MALNDFPRDKGIKLGDRQIIEEYNPDAGHIFLLFRRGDPEAFGIFDLRDVAKDNSEAKSENMLKLH